MSKISYDLDVDAPDAVSLVLRAAAYAYYESASELSTDWQDEGAGKPWEKIAKILERAADAIDKVV